MELALPFFGYENRKELKLGKADLISAFRKLASLLENGVAIIEGVEMLSRQSERRRGRGAKATVIYRRWLKALRDGHPFYDAMSGTISADIGMMVASGERSGNLSQALLDASRSIEGGGRIRKAIINGLIYPTVLLLAANGYLIMFATYMVPQFASVSNPATWHGRAGQIRDVSQFIASGKIVVIYAIIAALIWLFLYMLPRWTGPLRTRLDRFPPFSIYRLSVGAGFMLSLGALLNAGMPLQDAVDHMIHQISKGNAWLLERLSAARRGLRGGANLGEALEKAGHEFPDPDVIDEISVFATMPHFDKELRRIGEDWMDSVVRQVETAMRFINMIAIGIMAGMVIWIVLGMYALQGQLTQSVGM
jgi:type II secretory pathway component PulF